MNESKNTKKALHASLVSLFLCIVMLIGTTFAWFTDSASTGVNQIVSGKLDVALVDEAGNSLEGKTLEFVKAKGAAEKEPVLWEPGCKYELPKVYVKNDGNLALKYKIAITGIKGDAKLNEVIDWTIGEANMDEEYSLAAGAKSEPITIQGHMQDNAGNDYQGLTIDGISITVVATQDTVESDSFDNTYDENAEITVVKTASELQNAINNAQANETIVIAKGTDLTVNSTINVNKPGVTIQANGAVFKAKKADNPLSILKVNASDVTINGAVFEGTKDNPYQFGVHIVAGTKDVVVENCRFTGDSKTVNHAIWIDTNFNGNAVIQNNTFERPIQVHDAKNVTIKDNEFPLGAGINGITIYNESENILIDGNKMTGFAGLLVNFGDKDNSGVYPMKDIVFTNNELTSWGNFFANPKIADQLVAEGKLTMSGNVTLTDKK